MIRCSLIFACRANQSFGCLAPLVKIFSFSNNPNQFYIPAIPSHTKGRFAIVTNVGHGMRWTLIARLTNGADADGEVVWF